MSDHRGVLSQRQRRGSQIILYPPVGLCASRPRASTLSAPSVLSTGITIQSHLVLVAAARWRPRLPSAPLAVHAGRRSPVQRTHGTPRPRVPAPIQTLPAELLEHVLLLAAPASPAAPAALARTCRAFAALVYAAPDQHIWRGLFLRAWDNPRGTWGDLCALPGPGVVGSRDAAGAGIDWGREYRRRVAAQRWFASARADGAGTGPMGARDVAREQDQDRERERRDEGEMGALAFPPGVFMAYPAYPAYPACYLSLPLPRPPRTPPVAIYHLMVGGVVPRPIAFISSVSADGVENLAPFSWFNMVTSDPAVILLGLLHHQPTADASALKDTATNILVVRLHRQARLRAICPARQCLLCQCAPARQRVGAQRPHPHPQRQSPTHAATSPHAELAARDQPPQDLRHQTAPVPRLTS
ncbi:hypothetical protein POSPLADRAFT_1056485 [Postia placenta MAD-698-R-SB12]|uniref:F-box domain-containing protein n=1 Tax=Postia placenta MAD-698-R-SB12 TaxID=670580 RepID=A0A1X6N3F2_9APHY|nr:hypothetical protein POSPLADRAFT_1056485 [Postia placenta MAD-698-R-SB12]OSX63125.1 hypothetical protein POSPLADRAFT_1056485 [Postia placenta MAD-698-R-SB12]